MKILVSAYACEPDRGSEPEVGFSTVMAAAQEHDVWVLTRKNNTPVLESALANHPLAKRIHVVGVDLGPRSLQLKKAFGRFSLHWYYDRWQRLVEARARELEAQIGFDVLHHATFATYLQPSGLAALSKPFVWGPVGGAVTVPGPLLGELGVRGRAEELSRKLLLPILERRLGVRRTQRAATIALAQEAITASRLKHAGIVRVVSNATAASVDADLTAGQRDRDVYFVGRLIPWKGAKLAIRTMRHVLSSDTKLRIFGGGPDRDQLAGLVDEWGLSDRVRLEGRVPRTELHQRLAQAGVVLHTSLRGSGLSVAEALSLGTPLVCLDQGEVAAILERWPDVPTATVGPNEPERLARLLAERVDAFLAVQRASAVHVQPPTPTYREALLSAYRDAVEAF